MYKFDGSSSTSIGASVISPYTMARALSNSSDAKRPFLWLTSNNVSTFVYKCSANYGIELVANVVLGASSNATPKSYSLVDGSVHEGYAIVETDEHKQKLIHLQSTDGKTFNV